MPQECLSVMLASSSTGIEGVKQQKRLLVTLDAAGCFLGGLRHSLWLLEVHRFFVGQAGGCLLEGVLEVPGVTPSDQVSSSLDLIDPELLVQGRLGVDCTQFSGLMALQTCPSSPSRGSSQASPI